MNKWLIVGGNFGKNSKPSSIINQLHKHLYADTCVNGGTIGDVTTINMSEYHLIIWAPNIDNSVEKYYPRKNRGAVLICTKVLRKNRDVGDAISRIFKMHANAVITIDSSEKPFKFELVDALGNSWGKTTDLQKLSQNIKRFYTWTESSFRIPTNKTLFNDDELCELEMTDLLSIVGKVADEVELERGGRYFGNVSTRCSKMFPSQRINDNIILVSARNTPKDRLTNEDFVFTKLDKNEIFFHGGKKPSVDTPIQLNLYKHYNNINFIIHGHAYIKGVSKTEHYCPCGDLRELKEIQKIIPKDSNSFMLNLTNHGFIIGANSILQLEELVNMCDFEYKTICEKVL